MKIVLTGKMTQTRTRMYRNFTLCGITVMKDVSGNIDYLVTGDRPGQNKVMLADQLDKPIYTEEEFNTYLASEYPEYLL